MAESFGVEGRGAFYEEVGALRDVVQNHLLQVVALLAMEPPVGADADAMRDEKVKVFRATTSLDPADVVRGQYDGYRDEAGVRAGLRRRDVSSRCGSGSSRGAGPGSRSTSAPGSASARRRSRS